jgi:hypothetical protein
MNQTQLIGLTHPTNKAINSLATSVLMNPEYILSTFMRKYSVRTELQSKSAQSERRAAEEAKLWLPSGGPVK